MKATALYVFLLTYPVFGYHRSETRSGLVYFNSPESVQRPGIIGEVTLAPGQRSRIFFHFVNKTHQPQTFEVALDSPLSACALGVAVHRDPGVAGTLAAATYLYNSRKEILDVVKQLVPPGDTVSGIIEGVPKETAHVVCSMGTGSALPWKVSVGTLDLSRSAKLGQSLLFGDDSGPVKGAYGTVHHLLFANSESRARKIAVYFSPRGGSAALVYRHNNAVHTTSLIPARCAVLLFKDTVPAHGTLVLDSLPVGGYSYPGKISTKFTR